MDFTCALYNYRESYADGYLDYCKRKASCDAKEWEGRSYYEVCV